MVLIPQRLFGAEGVTTLLRNGNEAVLYKELSRPVRGREAYVANHAVSLLRSGRQELTTYEGNTIRIKAGEAVFIPRGVYYVTDLLPAEGTFESLLFYFGDRVLEQFLADTTVTAVDRTEGVDHLRFRSSEKLDAFTEAVLRVVPHPSETEASLLAVATRKLLRILAAERRDPVAFAAFLLSLTLPKRRGLRPFMEANYAKPLAVEDFAYLTGRSASSFRRDFRRLFGSSPARWLRARRLDRAARILRENERITVNLLAEETGYENVSYFIRAFRRHTGYSPGQYRAAWISGKIA